VSHGEVSAGARQHRDDLCVIRIGMVVERLDAPDRMSKIDRVINLLATPEKWCKAA